METKIKTNQAIWTVEFSNKYGRLFLRNVNENDWVYEDDDRIYELFAENDIKPYKYFCNYVGWHMDMTEKEIDILVYLLTGFNWSDIRYCIDILDNDVEKYIHEFLIKYNFRIYIDEITVK